MGVQTLIRTIGVTLVATFLIADALDAQTPKASFDSTTRNTCGDLIRWRMPRTTIVEATATDSRTIDVLVTQARIDAMILAAEAYCRLNGGEYPATLQDMAFPPEAFVAAMRSCRLDAEASVDSWGRPIFYAAIGGRLVVRSAGLDGQFTTSDDISVPASTDEFAEAFQIEVECHGAKPG